MKIYSNIYINNLSAENDIHVFGRFAVLSSCCMCCCDDTDGF